MRFPPLPLCQTAFPLFGKGVRYNFAPLWSAFTKSRLLPVRLMDAVGAGLVELARRAL